MDDVERRGGGAGLRLRLFAMMVLQVAVWGAWAPKLFPYMQLLSFSPGEQALVGSSWGIAGLLGIFFSNQLADRNFSAERFMAASHAISALCLLGAAFSTGFLAFFAFYLAYSLIYVPTLSVANSLALTHLPDPARDFGTVRMGGAIGWVLASWPFIFLLSAHSTAVEIRWIFIVAALISAGMAAYCLTLPHTPPRLDNGVDKLAWRRAIKLLRQPFVAVLFLVTFLDSVVHNGYFVLADAFLTDRVGIAGNLSMVVLSLGQVAEILAMLMLGRVLAKLGWRATMIFGILGHTARFLAFSFAADNIAIIIAVQLLHGICYAFFFATVYIFVNDVFPEDVRVSAQGLFNLLILGIGMVVASFAFPILRGMLMTPEGVDYHSLFMVPAGLAALGALLLLFLFRPPAHGPAVIRQEAPRLSLDPGTAA